MRGVKGGGVGRVPRLSLVRDTLWVRQSQRDSAGLGKKSVRPVKVGWLHSGPSDHDGIAGVPSLALFLLSIAALAPTANRAMRAGRPVLSPPSRLRPSARWAVVRMNQ